MHNIVSLVNSSLYISQSSLIFSLNVPNQIPAQISDILHFEPWEIIRRIGIGETSKGVIMRRS